MLSYETLTLELIPGVTPRDKYNYIKRLIKDRDENIVNIGGELTIQFVTHEKEYQAVNTNLERLGFKPVFQYLTEENAPVDYPVSLDRPEVLFHVKASVEDAAFISNVVQKSINPNL